MKDKSKLSTLDGILAFLFIVLLPVVAISIFQWDFSFPLWGYIIFIMASYRMYVIFLKQGNRFKYSMRHRTYEAGDEVETNVAGVTFENRQQIIHRIKVGEKVYLRRESENPYDKNAIVVLVNRYTNEERQRIKPELENKYGKFSYKEIFGELFAKDSIGYINRELAQKIAPIFDMYARKPNLFVNALVVNLTSVESENHTKGLRICFNLPTQKDLEKAMRDEMDSMMIVPPF